MKLSQRDWGFGLLPRVLPVMLAGAVLLGSCSDAVERLPRLPDDGVILAFGDSITFGTGAAADESYPTVLARLTGRRVVNAGVPGETTSTGLQRLPELLDRERPTLVILCHGGNDLLQYLDRGETAANLRAMVRLIQDRGGSVLLVAVPAPDLSLAPPALYREVAAEMRLPLEERALPRILAKGSLKADIIHPNAAGYARLADSLAKKLKRCGAL
jgi:lysophospholipase L1-like esterase